MEENQHETCRKRYELVLVFLAKARGEPQHQLHAFNLVHPIAKRGIDLFFLGCNDACRANRAKLGREIPAGTM